MPTLSPCAYKNGCFTGSRVGLCKRDTGSGRRARIAAMLFEKRAWRILIVALLACGPLFAQPAPQQSAPKPDTLPAMIPLFPLEDAALFPRGARPFHIFEQRYRAMIADALKGDRIIGMVTLQPGFESN